MGGVAQRGQASVEHVGLVLLVALVFAAIVAVAPLPGTGIAHAVARSLCAAVDADCAREASASVLPEPRQVVEELAAAPLSQFLAERESAGRDPRLDWSTDLCSAPLVGSTGASFDFTEACIRHDFGYRNYARLGLFDERRRAVDERFRDDMLAHCATRAGWERTRCEVWAHTFYAGVREFGWAAEDPDG